MPSPDSYRFNAADGDNINLTTLARRQRLSMPGEMVSAYGGAYYGEFATGAYTGISVHTVHQLTQDVSDIRLVYQTGWRMDGTVRQELPLANALTIRAAVQPVGVSAGFRFTFNGQRDGTTYNPSTYLVSDPLAIDLSARSQIIVRTYYGTTAGQVIPRGTGILANGISYDANTVGVTTGSDTTGTLNNPAVPGPGNFGAPIIIGTTDGTPYNSIFAVGDSIDQGFGDDTTNFNSSWLTRGCDANTPLYRYTTTGYDIQGLRAIHPWGLAIMNNFTHLYCGLGSNDIFIGRSVAQLQADLTWMYQTARKRGLKVMQSTILPRTNAGNTTPVAGFEAGANSNRGQMNAWIRAGGGGLIDQVIERSDLVESFRDSGLWGSGTYTSDGAHPSAAGAARAALSFNSNNLP